jgi:hypothetical protein
MARRLLCPIAALLVLALAIGACGGSDAATTGPSDETDEVETKAPDSEEPTETPEPTDTPVPTDTPIPPSPTPSPVGLSRSNPAPAGELFSAPGWDVQVQDLVRGDEAWQMIAAANMFNEPAPEGMEYILVYVSVVCTYEVDESYNISGFDFDVTGDALVKRSSGWVVAPEPALDAELLPGGKAEGWIAFAVAEGEGNLMLILEESWEDEDRRFLAINEGASISVDPGLASIEPTDLGTSRSDPAAFGETTVGEDWELTVLDVIRGADAWAMVQAANMFNDPADEGMEYVLVRMRARYINSFDEYDEIVGHRFRSVGDALVIHEYPSVVAPDPTLDFYVYPGGVVEGYIVLQAEIGEGGLMTKYEPWLSDEDVRYLSLEQ